MKQYDDEYIYRMEEIARSFEDDGISAKERQNKIDEVEEDCE